MVRLKHLKKIPVFCLLAAFTGSACRESLFSQTKGSQSSTANGNNAASDQTIKNDLTAPVLGGADYPEVINGSYLTSGWSEVSDTDDRVTILAQWHKKDGTLMPMDLVTLANANWSVNPTNDSAPVEVEFLTSAREPEQIIKLSLDSVKDSSLELAYLGPDLKTIETLAIDLGTDLPEAQTGSELMNCAASESLTSCFTTLGIRLYKKGDIQSALSPEIGSARCRRGAK